MTGESKTALVLAGGGNLGAVQAGMLRAVLEAGERFDMVVGASAGAINGSYFASDPTLAGVAKLESLWRSVTRRDVMPLTLGCLVNMVMRRDYVFENHGLRRLLENNLRYANLEETAIPLHVVATDLLTGSEVTLSKGPVVEAVLASAAIPGIYPAVTIDGRKLIDGGICNNTPLSVAVRLGAKRIMVMPTGFACAPKAPPRGSAALAMHSISLLVARQLVVDIEHYASQAEICVVPTLCPLEVSHMDYKSCSNLVERARTNTDMWIAGGGLRSSGVPGMLREHHH